MAKFQTVIKKARFHLDGYSAQEMITVGTDLIESITVRIGEGLDVYDAAAPPLSSRGKRGGYAAYKARVAPPAIRNWRLTGRTLRSLKVLTAGVNEATLGFSDPEAQKRAAINNRIARQFGTSPRDKLNLVRAIKQLHSPVSVKAA